jgi:O-antigen/teichoic acid export membrane protein
MSEIVETSIKKAAKGTTLILAGTVFSVLLLITTKILIARNTTKEELGAYTLAIAVVSVLGLIATLGVHEGIARYVSLFLGRNNPAEADSRSRAALQINLVSGIIAGIILYLCADFLSLSVFKSVELAQPLKILSLSVPFFVIAQVLNAILRGHGIITSKIYYIDVGIPLYFLLLLSGTILLNMPFLSILYAYVFAIILGCISIGSYGYSKIRLNPFYLCKTQQLYELLRFSFPLLLGIFMSMIMKWAGTLMLGRYAGAKAVGIFDVSNSLSMLLLFPLASLEFVFLPIAGSLHGKNQSYELARTYQVLTKWVFSVTVPAFFILFLFPEQTITLLFGERFKEAAPVLRILSFGLLFHSFWGPNGIIMVVIGMSKEISSISIFGAVLNIILNYILIKRYELGIIGASVATIGTYIALNVLVSIIIYRKANIQPFTIPYVKAIVCATITTLVMFIFSLLPQPAWLLPLYALIFVIAYVFLLIVTKSIDAEDISLIKAMIARIRVKQGSLKSDLGRPI